MSSSRSPNPYTSVIDLTSKAQAEERIARAKSSMAEPDPPLPEVSTETLPERVREAVERAGWTSLMPVQRKAIPYLLEGRDMIVQSKTGSGKTGAFLLPLFKLLDREQKGTQALILTPTRELARQIFEEFERIREDASVEGAVIYGGVRYGPQLKALKHGVSVIVGTPGRILDHLEQGNLDPSGLRMLVLDEADEMLSMGFYPDMRRLRRHLPVKRQSCMFSATIPPRVRSLADEFLRDPGFLSLSYSNVGVDEIEHRYYRVDPMQKDRILVRLIEMENPESAIIFANTKREVEYLGKFLKNYGYNAASISGDLSQRAREEVMGRIRAGSITFLVATDVAARGIDITDLSHVFMYDVPQDQEYYVHRSGRTARAGKTGTAIVLTTIEDYRSLLAIGQRYGISMTQADVPEEQDVTRRVTERLTVLLESRLRDRTNLERERLKRFLPLAEELAGEEPALLAMMLDDLYHELLHGSGEEEEEDPEPEQTNNGGQQRDSSGRSNKQRRRR
jgi:ATP-dependent RNA helicase DeaD